MDRSKVALYVRIPAARAVQLDEHVTRTGQSKQAVIEQLLTGLDDVPTPAATAVHDEVLTLDDVATMLRVDVDAVIARARAGTMPARRFGDEWRFSRAAVLRWLDGADPDRPAAGFGATQERRP